MSRIRLVTFDILHTLIVPRQPIHVQYAEVFKPYLGALKPDDVKSSFKAGMSNQREHTSRNFPAYQHGAPAWWSEVIKRTALGAGADPQRLSSSSDAIVPTLLHRFSSREGYKAFPDAIPTILELQNSGVQLIFAQGSVLQDLGFPQTVNPVALSEELGMEKPDRAIFDWTLRKYNSDHPNERVDPGSCLHIGDELECDFHGATQAGFHAVLLRRPGPEGEQAHKEEGEELKSVRVIQGLQEVQDIVFSQDGH
ncbi:HAD-like domain-containing protein [Ephemerocybe angulata]|uniref:HAD-like domain-containing protein n=1 Tax=Ephemerocybe angulata TaxID=980116 RepID=A0A8H6I7Y9_9AGAR|nr:HAD-like domain-containing protein [Tulosesus angulatus]